MEKILPFNQRLHVAAEEHIAGCDERVRRMYGDHWRSFSEGAQWCKENEVNPLLKRIADLEDALKGLMFIDRKHAAAPAYDKHFTLATEALKEQMYSVFNETDGFFASPDIFTKAEAEEFIIEFPKRFDAQGGKYKTGSGSYIPAKHVDLRLVPVVETTESEDEQTEIEQF